MEKIAVIAAHYFDPKGERKLIGGVETYVENLLMLFGQAGFCCTVYQLSERTFLREEHGAQIRGIPGRSIRDLTAAAARDCDTGRDLLLFATDFLIVKHPFRHSAAIQHGVAWDIGKPGAREWENWLSMLAGAFRAAKKYRRYRLCETLVCVDYNFLNWYRTQLRFIPNRCVVIPNFADVSETPPERGEGELSVIFARRLVAYRGTRLFADTAAELLDRHPQLHVTVAGEGPDEDYMRERLGTYEQVRFTAYAPEDSASVHRAHDIAVIPTLGSEGTSLSLLEAMAAGCAVIATQVGGMTNILLDRYNGLLIPPEREALLAAMEELVSDAAMRRRLGEKAHETVAASFSRERWRDQWLKLIVSMN